MGAIKMIKNYSIEVYNMDTNRWEVKDSAPTFDSAFDKAAGYVGFSKIHDTVAILDAQGCFVWKSDDPIKAVR